MTDLKRAHGQGWRLAAWAGVLAMSLAGCGGGGGADAGAGAAGGAGSTAGTGTAAITDVDIAVQTAISTYVSSSHPTIQLTGSATTSQGPVSFTMYYAFTRDSGSTTFEGSQVSSAVEQVEIRQDGTNALLFQSNQRSYFDTSPYAQYGSRDLFGTAYTVVSRSGALPTTARIGQAGVLGTATTYTDDTKAQVQGSTVTLVWNMEADGTSTDNVLLCLGQQTHGTTSGSSYCYRISRGGVVQNLVVRPSITG